MRVLVLLLVCLLLPLRGTLASTLLCAQQGPASTLNTAADQMHHAMPCHAADTDGSMHDHHHGTGHGSADQDTPSGDGVKNQSDGCHVCCASACAAALTAAAPGTPGALPVPSTVFPALRVPAPDFLSDGQERPPRTI